MLEESMSLSTLRNPDWVQKDFSIAFRNIKVRYVKIFAKNLAELPPWHPESGGKPWLMIDEIVVEYSVVNDMSKIYYSACEMSFRPQGESVLILLDFSVQGVWRRLYEMTLL